LKASRRANSCITYRGVKGGAMCSCGSSDGTSKGHSHPDVRTRILIVDDDPAFRMMCEAAILRDGSLETVASCCSVCEAMAALAHVEADVGLVDLGLPDGSGVDVIRAIRRRQPRCDVMVISVFHDEEPVLRAIGAGATGYLLKDSAPPDIAGSIHALRAGGAPISPMIARLLLDRMRSPSAALRAAGRAAGALALSEREIEILSIVSRGLSLADIARLLGISVNTVKTHVKRIYRKLAVRSRTEAVFEAQCMGLLHSGGGNAVGDED
jgi:DNA-binding NarL/FixJ family response regulator